MTGVLHDRPTDSAARPAGPATPAGEVSRYPGSPPFADTAIDRMLFRGRARETDEVLHSVLSYDLLLVYAVSGMGKTSLLTAGVLEPLRQRDYFPVIIRLNSPETGIIGLIEQQIRQAADATPDVEIVHAPTVRSGAAPASTLWDLFAELEVWRRNTLQQLVLIFDQFEELFTLQWEPAARAQFIEQFGEVVRRHRVPGREVDAARQALPPPNVKVVLCMREDFIGQLEELAVSVPQILQRRFRLGPLAPDQAMAAICEPAALDDPRLRTQRFSYSEGAATTILTFLRTKDERGKPVVTDAIDPSQLQIICQHVERSILPGKSPGPDGAIEISESDLGGQEGLRRIVGDFYRRVLEAFPPKERKAIRHLCETGLISQTGRRLSQEEGEIDNHFAVTRDMLRLLVDLRLLRSEPRVGSIYYELAHDTLTGPILAYRDAHRRKRRRRWAVAALVVLAVAAVVVTVILILGNDRQETAGAAPPTPIGIGDELPGELTAPTFTALYEVSGGEQPLTVELRPSGFNGVLTVTRLDSTAASQTQDVGLAGAPEFAIIGAGAGRYRIAVSGPGAGEFVLGVRSANSTEVPVPGTLTALRLPTTGGPLLFQLAGSPNRAFVVTVRPVPTKQRLEPFPPQTYVQVIDPAGGITPAHLDETGEMTDAGEPTTMSVIGGGSDGTYVVAIGDPSGSTKLAYNVTIAPIEITPMSLGVPSTVPFDEGQSRAAFEISSPDERELHFDLRDEDFGAQGEVHLPNGDVEPIAVGELTFFSGGPGRYLVFINGAGSSEVTLTVDAPSGFGVELGGTASGTLDDEHALALFRVQATGEVPLLAEVKAFGALDAVLSLVSTDEDGVQSVDFSGEGGSEQMVIPTSKRGPQLLAVTTFEGSSGPFEFSVRPAPIEALSLGHTLSAHLEPGELATYTLTTTDEQPFVVGFTAGEALDAAMEVHGPGGDEFAQTQNMYLSDGRAGTYTFTIRNYASVGDFHISAAPLTSDDQQASGPLEGEITGEGSLLAFDIDVPDGQVRFVSIATGDGLAVDATITNGFNTAVAFAGQPIVGGGTITLPDAAGRHRVIVSGSAGSGTVRVIAGGEQPKPLPTGSTSTVDASHDGTVAIFTPEPLEGVNLVALTVQPSPNGNAAVSIVDADGNRVGGAASATTATYVIDGDMGQVEAIVSAQGDSGRLTIRSEPLRPAATTIDAREAGSVAAPGDVAAYDLDVVAFQGMRFTVTPAGDLDPQVVVIDPFGSAQQFDETHAGEIESACVQNGEGVYHVVVSGAAGTTGRFMIELTDPSLVDPALDPLGTCGDPMLRSIAENLQS